MGVGGQRHAPAALPPAKTRYPLYRRLSGPYGRPGRIKKIFPQRDSIPDQHVRSLLLYTLSYPGSQIDIYVYINTYLESTYSPGFSVQKSKWTKSATHSVRYISRLRWTATNPLHHQTKTQFSSKLSEAKYSLSPVATVWGYLVVCWRCWQGRGRIDICGIGKG